MRDLAYEYYLENGSYSDITYSDVGVNGSCDTQNFFAYHVSPKVGYIELWAYRCSSGGKAPNAPSYYFHYLYYPDTGGGTWGCRYAADNSPCFGYPAW
jgi:hypothetical protein